MPAFADQTGKEVYLPGIPAKIISVVPSQTELLYDLGLEQEVIAITKFCIHPAKWFINKTKAGGTKNLNLALIHQLAPDLIIANKEENTKEQIDELANHYPVWVSDINNLSEAYDMIIQLGEITGKKEIAATLVRAIQSKFNSLPGHKNRLRAAYLIWHKPLMTTGSNTFIHSMLHEAGFDNVFKDCLRYPTTTIDDINARKPELILLSSEPFPFTEKHAEELQQLIPEAKVILVDGEMFSWYGSHLLQSPGYFQQLKKRLV
ncbi:MAG: transporter substrate-binding protein [Chitinophagaceae bacterium]|nr:transporter substrate-binding protein [Chitinophagaceae bacterium]